MPDSYAFEGWGNWPTWAVYLELSCDGSAWAKWVSVARSVREEAEERPGLPADTAALGALSARLRLAHVRDLQSHADLNAKLTLWALDQVKWDAVRSLHARAGCGNLPSVSSTELTVSPRARGMRESMREQRATWEEAGLSTRARDAGRHPTRPSRGRPDRLDV